nr:MAG TPA: hypothetical protein [Caudoviricetes sp.]
MNTFHNFLIFKFHAMQHEMQHEIKKVLIFQHFIHAGDRT